LNNGYFTFASRTMNRGLGIKRPPPTPVAYGQHLKDDRHDLGETLEVRLRLYALFV
jgi:hypothetical protein